jgi:hypothetical protein
MTTLADSGQPAACLGNSSTSCEHKVSGYKPRTENRTFTAAQINIVAFSVGDLIVDGRVVPQAVSSRLPTAAARDRAQVGFVMDKAALGSGFL